MSTSGIRNTGINQPITPKESVPVKKKNESSKSEGSSSIKDSFKISDDGLKLDKVFKDLSSVKSFLADNSVDSQKLIRTVTSGVEPEFLQEEAQQVLESLTTLLDETTKDPEKAVKVHGNITPESVLKLELPEIEEITATFNAVEQFIGENPQKAISAQAFGLG